MDGFKNPDSQIIKVARNLFQKNKKGKVLQSSARKSALNIFIRLKDENPNATIKSIVDRASELTGLSASTLFKIEKEAKSGILQTPGKKRPNAVGKRTRLNTYDSFTLQSIRRRVHSFYKRNEIPTVKKLLNDLNNEANILQQKISERTLCRLLNDIGFSFKKRRRQSALIERDDIIAWRRKYLRDIKLYKEQQKIIYYLDETWVNAGISTTKVWQDKTIKSCSDARRKGLSTGLKGPSGKGGRLIITHVGSERGFVNDAADIFSSKKTKDYHEEMDGNHFESWFKSKLIPKLEPNSIIVMDNASYHSVKEEKLPTQSWRKKGIQEWLTNKNIPWGSDLLKLELLQIVSTVKHKFDGYRIDKIASETGHKVLRLPPYHCELNPIELIWAQVKGYIARQNQTFKLPEVKNLLLEALDKVSGNDWKNAVAHVTKIEKEFWTMDGLIEDVWEQNELTIQLSDSDSTQESESFSS
ncbi:hypothetical protein AVEN_81248-1 [Araneus ventricosus]|uniref:Tc1-like transposase DDE domain-containing protein n=1 Tax=Araneus ventricosus TaxID=182803 RepID=A0A4Y2V0S9_ARAVE|nr:hypothetical protein AVEN_81248-1 [Araneus ventricosus]